MFIGLFFAEVSIFGRVSVGLFFWFVGVWRGVGGVSFYFNSSFFI